MPTTINKTIFSLLLVINMLSTLNSDAQQPLTPASSGYAPLNGSKVYYEVYGAGDPIVLLHGAYMTINSNWSELIPILSKTRKVIALELEGHGHTPLSQRPLSYQTLASDVAVVLKHLKIDSADILGFSYGGTVAFQFAIQQPAMTKKLIIISSTYKSEGWLGIMYTMLTGLKPDAFDNTPIRSEYIKSAPDTSNWHKFIAKMLKFSAEKFNLGDDKIKNIKAPVLLIMGDNDGTDKKVLAETYSLLGGNVFGDVVGMPRSQLAILPAKGHGTLMMDTQAIAAIVGSFLATK
ncbi:MAG: alpha/beta hydrolase [Bacteroidetes bacterium]|nr:MAG: alpha/beta hydrolase [Bacteroidota bacterium]